VGKVGSCFPHRRHARPLTAFHSPP
jgi:hypothetical protein